MAALRKIRKSPKHADDRSRTMSFAGIISISQRNLPQINENANLAGCNRLLYKIYKTFRTGSSYSLHRSGRSASSDGLALTKELVPSQESCTTSWGA
jgi:hypothetical protein